ncbi:MAG TPA: hypothetical protein VKT72_02305 [Candidatus Baltobacteraceae bacterium]|nr:hypothetical protein [Candidatus Baltobacteraceae bacterium]
MKPIHIEILTFEDCPNATLARERVVKALEAEGLAAEIAHIDVPTIEAAQAMRFLGSPSVRVNGNDVESDAHLRSAYGLMCRTYNTGGQTEGAPSVDDIRAGMRAVHE